MNEILNQVLHQIVSIIVGGVCAYLWARLKEKERMTKLGRQADIVILRNIIRQACKRAINKKWVPLDEKSDILACYDTYEELIRQSGVTNGVIEDIVKQFRQLPNIPPKE